VYFSSLLAELSQQCYARIESSITDATKYRGADKSLARPGRKKATATEDFDVYISYVLSQLEEY